MARPIFQTVSRVPLIRIYDEAGPFNGQRRVKYRPIEVEGVLRGYFAHRPSGWRYTGGWGVYSLMPNGWHDQGSAASGSPQLVSGTSHDRGLALGWIAALLEKGRLPAPEEVGPLLAAKDVDLATQEARSAAERAEWEARYAAQAAERERQREADRAALAVMLEGLASARDRGDLTNFEQAAVVEAIRRFER